MSKKNEILLSIALEGDSEVKRKLDAVGETGKKSLDGIGKNLGGAKKSFSELREAAGGLREGLAPLAEASGLSGLLGGAGLGGLFGSLGRFATGPGGLLAGITGALVGMAKFGDETARVKGRLAGLGDAKGFDRLTERAKGLGTDVGNLQPRYERFLALQQKLNVNPNIVRPPGAVPSEAEEAAAGVQIFGGGRQISAPSKENFGRFDSALLSQIRRDVKTPEEAQTIAADFEQQLASKGLTAEALRGLQQSSPNAAKFITSQLSKSLSQGFANPSELAAAIESGRVPQRKLGATEVINAGAKPNADFEKAAESARGLSQSFEALQGATGRLLEAFGGDHVGLGKAIDGAAKLVDDAAENVDRKVINPRDYEPGGPKFIGPVNDAERQEYNKPDVVDLAKTLITGNSDERFGDSNAVKVMKFLRDGPQFLQQTTPEQAIDSVKGALHPDLTALPPQNQGSFAKAILDSAPQQALIPPQQPQQFLPPQLSPPAPAPEAPLVPPQVPDNDTSQTAPDKLGALDGAAGAATEGLTNLASAIDDAIARLGQSDTQIAGATSQPVTVAAAAGGLVRMLDNGGHVSGPGTATSDSIPAMLSDNEYVIKASSARKIGRRALDWLNRGAYAIGGLVRRLAGGGSVGNTRTSLADLGPGQHSITADPDTGGAYIDGVYYRPGSPILDDPTVRQAIEESQRGGPPDAPKKKGSSFTGFFGYDTAGQANGGPVGGYASGGPVGAFASGGSIDRVATIRRRLAGRFANGGLITLPQFDIGGPADPGAAPQLPELAVPGGGSLGHYTVDLRTNHGDFRLMSPDETARQMSAAARDSANAQTGQRPGWYRGR